MSNTSTFPTTLDAYTNPTANNFTNSPSLAAGQTLQNDSLTNVETLIGITGSTVTSTLQYKIGSLIQQNTTVFTDTGSANAYVITPSPAYTSYTKGLRFTFLPANTNTSVNATLNVNSLGTKTILYNGVILFPGNLTSGVPVTVIYDGTQFQVVNPVWGPWVAWTPSFGGFSVSPTVVPRYQVLGKLITINVETTGAGTSNATNFTMSLPYSSNNNCSIIVGKYLDNGSTGTGVARMDLTSGSPTATFYTNMAGAGWTNSGSKFCNVSSVSFEST